MENKAAFSLEKYHFSKVNIDLDNRSTNDLRISFDPSGKFFEGTSAFELKFVFNAYSNEQTEAFVVIECLASFKFENVNRFEDVPSYFYRNSIAIIFPYIRAFISTVTLQANIPPVILPTMNLAQLEIPLKENTIQQ